MKKLLQLLPLIVILFSCSKEEDPLPPTIQLSSPVHLDTFNGVDTVQFLGQVNDDKDIERITITLKDASNGATVQNGLAIYPNSSTYNIDFPYYLNDINLASGNYYFEIRAHDEVNTTRHFVDIVINGVPKQRQGIIFADNAGGNNNIHVLDNAFNASLLNTSLGNLTGIGVDALNQHLIIAPNSSGDLSSIALPSGSANWNDNLNWDVTAFHMSDNYTYIGMEDGSIKRYNANGLSNFHGNANLNFHVQYITEHEDYLVMEEQMLVGSTVILALRWKASGVTAQQLSVNEDIVGAYGLSANELVLITNNSSNLGNLLFYDIAVGQTSSPFSINTAQIDACVEVGNGTYIVAENNQLTMIDANAFSTSTYMAATSANQLYFDPTSNELIVVNGNTISIYDYNSKMLIGNYSHTSLVTSVEFWYNKN